MLTYHQLGSVAFIWWHYHKQIWIHIPITDWAPQTTYLTRKAPSQLKTSFISSVTTRSPSVISYSETNHNDHHVNEMHYCDVIVRTMAPQITSLTNVTQPFIQAQIKENIKATRHWPLWGKSTDDLWIPAQRASNAENVSIWWRHRGNSNDTKSKHRKNTNHGLCTFACLWAKMFNHLLKLRQNGRHFADNMLKMIFFNENCWISFRFCWIYRSPVNSPHKGQ